MKKNAKNTVMQFKKPLDINIMDVEIRLHPKAKHFLFEHYATLQKMFCNVLRQQETDYISIALINKAGEIFFLSSNPSIEQNLIEKGLWQLDGSYQSKFIIQDEAKLWSEFYYTDHSVLLRKYKQLDPSLVEGISIPMEYEIYKAVFSFGFKRINLNVQNKTPILCKRLSAMGKYFLKDVRSTISFPDEHTCSATKPKLELIINNQEK